MKTILAVTALLALQTYFRSINDAINSHTACLISEYQPPSTLAESVQSGIRQIASGK